jgi:hypothetical protein
MQENSSWSPRKPSRVRRVLNVLKRLRYRLHYRGVLREFKQFNPAIRRFRLSTADKRRIRDYWRSYGIPSVNLDWYRLYGAMLGTVDERMIPEELFRVELEDRINTECMAAAQGDKNGLSRTFPAVNQPKTLLRNINGHYFDAGYAPLTRTAARGLLESHDGPLIIKPSIGSGSGFNIHRIEVRDRHIFEDDRPLTFDFIEKGFGGKNFLLQEVIAQHPSLAAYHPKSVNTCRVITIRLDDAFHAIAGTFRMGRGKYVDNGHAGGLLCGISDTGALTPFALDCEFRRYDAHPITRHPFADQAIPHYAEMKQMAISVHRQLIYHNMVSFDIALDINSRPCLVEINLFGQGIEPHQLLQGRPIFGDFTDTFIRNAVDGRQGSPP